MSNVNEPSYIWDKHGVHLLYGSYNKDPELRQFQRDKSMARFTADLINKASREHTARTEQALAANRDVIAKGNTLLVQNLNSLEQKLSSEINKGFFEVKTRQDKTYETLEEIRDLVGLSAGELARIEHFDQAEKYFTVGRDSWELEMFEAAKKEFQKAVAINPNDYWSLKELGFIHLYVDELADIEQSIDLYGHALLAARVDLHSNEDRIRYSKHAKPTRDELKNVIDECHSTLAFANFRFGNFTKAIEFQQSFLKDSKSWFGYIQLARYLVAHGAHDEAFQACKEAIDMSPEKFELIGGFEDLTTNSRIREGLDHLYQGVMGKLTDLFVGLDKVHSALLQGELVQIQQELSALTYAHLIEGIAKCEALIESVEIADKKLNEIRNALVDFERKDTLTKYWSELYQQATNGGSKGIKHVMAEINTRVEGLAIQKVNFAWEEEPAKQSMEQRLGSLQESFHLIKEKTQATTEIIAALKFLPIWVKLDPEKLEELERDLEDKMSKKKDYLQEITFKNRERIHRRFCVLIGVSILGWWIAMYPKNAGELISLLWPNSLFPKFIPDSQYSTFSDTWTARGGPFTGSFLFTAILILAVSFPNNPIHRLVWGKRFYYPHGFKTPGGASRYARERSNAEFNNRHPFWDEELKLLGDQIIALRSLLALQNWFKKLRLHRIRVAENNKSDNQNWLHFLKTLDVLQVDCNEYQNQLPSTLNQAYKN